jgi:hypothetical protein
MTTWSENLVYDIRMHRGEDTDFYERIGFNVIGFEANPDLIEQCKIRFQDAITTGRLRIAEDAVAPRAAGDAVTFCVNAWSPRDVGLKGRCNLERHRMVFLDEERTDATRVRFAIMATANRVNVV